jgi:hypothetical protein
MKNPHAKILRGDYNIYIAKIKNPSCHMAGGTIFLILTA